MFQMFQMFVYHLIRHQNIVCSTSQSGFCVWDSVFEHYIVARGFQTYFKNLRDEFYHPSLKNWFFATTIFHLNNFNR